MSNFARVQPTWDGQLSPDDLKAFDAALDKFPSYLGGDEDAPQSVRLQREAAFVARGVKVENDVIANDDTLTAQDRKLEAQVEAS